MLKALSTMESGYPMDPNLNPWGLYEIGIKTFQAVTRILAQGPGSRELMRKILRTLEENLGASRGTVMILEPGGETLIVEAVADGMDAPHQAAAYGKGDGIIGTMLKSGQAEIVPLLRMDPRFQGRLYGQDRDMDVSFICVPIRMGDTAVGSVSVELPPQKLAYLMEVSRVLEILANLIAHDIYDRRLTQPRNPDLENPFPPSEKADRPGNIQGESSGMRLVFTRIHQVAASSTTVLIRGESGTGKELVASAIHFNSPRANKSLVKVNCAALSEGLLESELFGHERGAFTGALSPRIGRVEEAEGGTLFLDEIGEFSPTLQVKLLRLLQEREYERVGSNETRRANVRIITATNRDLEKALAEGVMRQDLYYRVNVFPIHLPPLRERKSDIPLLINHLVRKHAKLAGQEVRRISAHAFNLLTAYHWPGNVRELENCIEYALLLSREGAIYGHDLPPALQGPEEPPSSGAPETLEERVAILEGEMITDALKHTGGKISAAARRLGLNERVLRYKIKKLGLEKDRSGEVPLGQKYPNPR
jgi:Nif-specific regulatory protein